MMKKNSYKKGQIVLFVVIILTVSVIIVTSIFNRSLISQRDTSVNTDSTRAFNAAESGIDELLARSDLAAIAGPSASTYETSSVDPSQFSESSYQVALDTPNFFETKDEIPKNSILQIEFNFPPTYNVNEAIYFKRDACLLLSAFSTTNEVRRLLVCGDNQTEIQDYIRVPESNCVLPHCSVSNPSYYYSAGTGFNNALNPALFTIDTLLIKVLLADTRIRMTADDYSASFKTKNIVANAWAVTNSGVRKEIQVNTKTTRDVFSIFDYALYVR